MRRVSRITAGFDRFFGQISAARACATAIESGRRPSQKALRTLGVDPNAFDHIG